MENDIDNPTWQCEACTLKNLLLRPSCAACATARPESVFVPDDYTASAAEHKYIAFNPKVLKWTCETCTCKNALLRPSCETCYRDRPASVQIPPDYVPSEQERKFVDNDDTLERQHVAAEQTNVVQNNDEIECIICMDDIAPGQGMILHNCHHAFCIDCLRGSVEHSEGAEVICPGQEGAGACKEPLLEREIRAIAPKEIVDKLLDKGISLAEAQERDSFHCLTSDCPGWCIVEERSTTFRCNKCGKPSCLRCKVIHEGQTCGQYKDGLNREANRGRDNERAARAGEEALLDLVRQGVAMHCPHCRTIIQKLDGCNHMVCTMCRRDFQWTART